MSTSLTTLKERYSGYNLLLPVAEEVAISPMYRYQISTLQIDTSESSGDIYKVSSVNRGTFERPDWVTYYALTGRTLDRLAGFAGLSFLEASGKRISANAYCATAKGVIIMPDGTPRFGTDQKEIDLADREAKYRMEFTDKAEKGITDKKQAREAAELYPGEWKDIKDRFGNTVKGYVIDKGSREKYISRAIQVNMALLRESWAQKAVTGAKLRVIRSMLGIKNTYTLDELKKGFAIVKVTFNPDYSDPFVKRTMLLQGMNSVANLFGSPAIPVRHVAIEDEAIDIQDEAEATSAAFQSDQEEDIVDGYRQQDPADNIPPARETMPSRQDERQPDYVCDQCGAEISEKVYEFSLNRFGRPLCIKCQRGGTR